MNFGKLMNSPQNKISQVILNIIPNFGRFRELTKPAPEEKLFVRFI